MDALIIEKSAFDILVEQIEELKTIALSQKIKEKWLDNQEFIRLMKISKRTAQHYRDSGVIPFAQIGAKIYYKLSDIEELLEENYKNNGKAI